MFLFRKYLRNCMTCLSFQTAPKKRIHGKIKQNGELFWGDIKINWKLDEIKPDLSATAWLSYHGYHIMAIILVFMYARGYNYFLSLLSLSLTLTLSLLSICPSVCLPASARARMYVCACACICAYVCVSARVYMHARARTRLFAYILLPY